MLSINGKKKGEKMKKIVDIEKCKEICNKIIMAGIIFDSDKKAALNYVNEWLQQQPNAEEKHGKWNIRSIDFLVYGKNDVEFYIECSACGRTVKLTDENPTEYRELCKKYPYCHCGAKMDSGEEE